MSGPSNDDRPDWWRENEAIREELGLSEYDPPRFADGTYVHEVVPDVEDRYGVELRFVGVDTRYGDDWEVRADGDTVLTVGRHRDENGNTVYETTAEAFLDAIRAELSAT